MMNLLERAIDDLEFLLKIVQKHEPGSYRASDTIVRLREQNRGKMQATLPGRFDAPYSHLSSDQY